MNESNIRSVSVGDVFGSDKEASKKVFGYAPKGNYFLIETPKDDGDMFYAGFIYRDTKGKTAGFAWENYFSKNDEKIIVIGKKGASSKEKAEHRDKKKIVLFVENNGTYKFVGVYIIDDIIVSAESNKVVFFYKRIATKYCRSAK